MEMNGPHHMSTETVSKIGLFGGTFNPVHLGHLRCVVEVKEAFSLDQLIIIPAKNPPHKHTRNLADIDCRMEMIHLALSGMEGFSLSDVEILRSGPSYTIDTVNHFLKTNGARQELYFIMGLDAFLEIETWKAFRHLFSQVSIIVMIRPGTCRNEINPEKEIEKHLVSHISPDYKYDADKSGFFHNTLNPVHLIRVTPMGISSTQIRSLVKNGRSIKYLVEKDVEAFIFKKGLYK